MSVADRWPDIAAEHFSRTLVAISNKARGVCVDTIVPLTLWDQMCEEARTSPPWHPEIGKLDPGTFRKTELHNCVSKRLPMHRSVFVSYSPLFVDRLRRATERIEDVIGKDEFRELRLLADLTVGSSLWAYHGQPTYCIDRKTAEALLQTDVPNFPSTELHFPNDVFYLALPEGVISRVDTQHQLPIDGLLVWCDDPGAQEPEYERILNIIAYSKLGGTGERAAIIAGEAQVVLDNVAGMALAYAAWDIPMWRKRSLREVATGHGYDAPSWTDSARVEAIPQLVINFVLYMMGEHPEIRRVPKLERHAGRGGKKQKRDARRAERRLRLAYIEVGGQTSHATAEKYTPTGHALDHPVWVRGHFRQQAFGTKHTQRKTLWIKPHRRGPDMATTIVLKKLPTADQP